MYCNTCGSNKVVLVTHFEKDRNPTRHKECRKCHSKSKEISKSFGEILRDLQNNIRTK